VRETRKLTRVHAHSHAQLDDLAFIDDSRFLASAGERGVDGDATADADASGTINASGDSVVVLSASTANVMMPPVNSSGGGAAASSSSSSSATTSTTTSTSISASVAGATMASDGDGGSVRVWDMLRCGADNVLQPTLVLGAAHVDGATVVRVARRRALLVSGGRAGQLATHRLADGAQLAAVVAHAQALRALEFNARESVLISGAVDGSLRTWTVC
jgi:WD40 repeat protein